MAWQCLTICVALLATGCANEQPTEDDRAERSPSSTSLPSVAPRSDAPASAAPSSAELPSSVATNTARPAELAPKLFTDDDFRRHVEELKTELLGSGFEDDRFHIMVVRPFVVVGDERPEVVERRAERTIQWAVTRLKQDFFRRDPTAIVDIWLFKDKESYERNTQKLFGRRPHTPFGYYSPRDEALVMNISTGGGTLVHEIVHPFVAADFPKCPAWLNEGLGSLFEQCGQRDKRIVGYTNWRLRGLQRAIRDSKLPTFKTLCLTSTDAFYHADPGTNYAQARYLCYYLQEHDLLRKYYRQFREAHRQDPAGFAILQEVLGEADMPAFQSRWERWVLELRFPG